MCRDYGNVKIADALRHVRECIDNGIEYYDKKDEKVRYVISLAADANVNKEHFADVLLRQATSCIEHGLFKISKKENGLGRCWITGCNELRVQSNGTRIGSILTYHCQKCKYPLRETDYITKIKDVDGDYMLAVIHEVKH